VKTNWNDNLESIATEFFATIRDVGIKLESQNVFRPEIVLHVHTDMAQTYFDLPQCVIWNLGNLKIPFGISLLSWGMVEDEN
jgi:hypothetical protein